MKPTDKNDAHLFLAPAGSAAAEDEAETVDSSAAAMNRLRDPFAVDVTRRTPDVDVPRRTPDDEPRDS